MDDFDRRKDRLHNLIHLARVTRGMSRAELGRALGRDPTKIYPDSGNPKMDFLVRLADLLEWPVGDVVEAIWHGGGDNGVRQTARSFEDCNELVMAALRAGDFKAAIEHAGEMAAVARTPDEIAHVAAREAAAWDGLGRYPKVLESARRGLTAGPLSLRLRLALQAIQANAQYTLWDLTPALGTCEILADWYEKNPPERRVDQKRVAYVHYVRGNIHRRLFAMEPENREHHIARATTDLSIAIEMHRELAREFEDDSLNGVANLCEGGLIELSVEKGERSAAEAVAALEAGLERRNEHRRETRGPWLESYGWWCIFGSNIAMRSMTGRDLQQTMSRFTKQALSIANELDNWAMRERVFTMQFLLHQDLVESTGLDLDFTIDDDERNQIMATMGRFPCFRSTGWRILETARVVQSV